MRYYLAALASAALATSAEADAVKVNFAGQFDSGSFAGQYYEGDFTYDTYFKFVDNYDKYTYYSIEGRYSISLLSGLKFTVKNPLNVWHVAGVYPETRYAEELRFYYTLQRKRASSLPYLRG